MIKVFVSSKQGELDPEREALHRALQSPEWDNFTFEWSGAFTDSARAVYLKQVAEADVYLGIFSTAYSQPTVDEYHKAKELGKPILIYLKKCTREAPLEKFINDELRIPSGPKYQEFDTTDELVSHLPDIRRALDAEVQKHQRQAYLDALVAQTELLELAGIVDTGEQERPKLQEIFVALSAAEEVEEREERQPKDKRDRERPIKITRRVTIEQALREHRHLMILGDPGAGKSTLLRYLTLVAAMSLRATREAGSEAIPNSSLGIASSQKTLLAMTDAKLGLPILIRLSSFARSGQSFVEYFGTYAEKQLHVSLGEKFFERALEDGQAIVCLDGLDEVSQPAQRFDVRNAITALANRYPRNRFIVTSRVAGYESASLDKRAFAHHTIVPFSEKEIQSFVEKWYAAREREPEQAKSRAANLFNDLKANERLLKLAENPLTLTIIALVHQRAQGKLPDARVELYDRCAETLIEEWDKWKGLAPEDRERPYYCLRRRLLERAACWMHIESGRGGVTPPQQKRALEMKVAEFLVEDKTLNLSEDTARIEAKQFVALATSRTGILVEREQGAVSFIHLTFQEYFAASDLYWRYHRTPDALWQAIQPYLYDSRWLEVILLLLGRLNDDGDTPSIIVEKILREHDRFDDVIHRDLFLAARCLADGVQVRESLRNKIVDALDRFVSARHPKYDSLRDDSIQALDTLRGNVRAGDGLLAWVQGANVDSPLRYLVAQALGPLGQMNEVDRSSAMQVSEQPGQTDHQVDDLVKQAQDETMDVLDRTFAISMLREMGQTDHKVMYSLLALAQDVRVRAIVRSEAVQALGQLGYMDTVVIQALLILAQDERADPWVRGATAQVLGQLGYKDNTVAQGLLVLAQNAKSDAWVRSAAVRALGQLGYTDDALRLLLVITQDEKADAWMRHDAVQALQQLGTADDALQRLLALAQGERVDADVRRYAAYALGELGHIDDAVRLLLELAQDKKVDKYVRRDATHALGWLGHNDDAVICGLFALAQDEIVIPDVRSSAVEVLGQLGKNEPRVALALLELASDKEPYVRNDAYDALNEVVGNLRYAEVENGQKRIKRTGRKALGSKQKAVGRKRKKEIPRSARNDKSKIRNHKS